LPGIPALHVWGRGWPPVSVRARDAARTPHAQAHLKAVTADADADAGSPHADGVYSDAYPRAPNVYAHGDLYAYAHADADEHA
jgi:hypothetical protein